MWESIFIEVSGFLNKNHIIVHKKDHDTVLEELTPITLIILKICKHEGVIAGVFNIYLLNIRVKINASDFFDTPTSNSFFPQITFPTRFSKPCGTLIDKFFVKYPPIGATNVSGILTHRLSDYQPYFLVIDTILVKKVPPKMIESRRLSTKNINDFVDSLSACNMYDQLNAFNLFKFYK